MPATDSEPASMEDAHALQEAEGSSTNMPSAAPPAIVPSSTPHFPTENKAVSVASNDCSSALSSPAEASPAKPAAMSPAPCEPTVETSTATSHAASAADSPTCTGASLVRASEPPPPPPPLTAWPTTTYGNPDVKNDFPSVLTFKGVGVTLENNSVWKQFYGCGTEMILTKPGRRMFPYCRYRLSGLEPERQYSLVLSIVPSDQYKYRWSATKWELTGAADHQGQGLSRAFSHHYSPSLGSEWMSTLVSFYKLKLTNHPQDLDGHVVLHSMHRYIPRLHVIPAPDGHAPTPEQPVVMGPESMTFTFPQTEFMAVTTYQNFRITQLKINHNPFAKGFREHGNNTRLHRIPTKAIKGTQTFILTPAEPNENTEEVVDLSTKAPAVSGSFPNEQASRLVLKPIMSTSSTKNEPFVACLRGKHSLGELVLVQKGPLVEPKEEPHADVSVTPDTSTPTPESAPGSQKKRKKLNRRWANSRGKEWKPAAASPTVFHSPSLTVAMQPELDDVEGLLFVSFTSKEALEVHIGDKPANSTPAASPISPLAPMRWREEENIAVDAIPETDEEKVGRSEAVLLQDLRVLKHRQVIHPVLQQVGMKLSSLDPMKPIDLQYLGVHLPLPPPKLPEKSKAVDPSPGDKGLSFTSRTGKTSDVTQIKGWRNKFIRKKDTPPPISDGSQKNLSAFCSNMLDEYLESEAQYISDRAAAFSTHAEDSVAYQLPVKGSSYVKTLDSVLKNRKAASKSPLGANRPCPLSHKPLLYSALAAPAPPLAAHKTPPGQTGVQSTSASSQLQPVAQRLAAFLPSLSPRPSVGQNLTTMQRPAGLNKTQLRLTEMEFGALNQGLSRTQLTTDRLSVALAGLLTKEMLASQVWKVTRCPTYTPTGPECRQEFCTLGCVCSSLQHLNRPPFHCRRPECMFGCACFKRKITKQLSAGEREALIQPVYSMTNMEHMVQPHPGSHANKLWNRDTHGVDPEPLFTPKSAPTGPACLPPVKVAKRNTGAFLSQPIREEDKDPVYRYLESLMTCARVREFNSKPPPVLTIEPKTADIPAKPQQTSPDEQPKKCPSPLPVKKEERPTERTTSGEKEAKKQIEIQSACQWVKDRKMVLEALCQRMNQNRLSRRFWVGPYRVRPIAKIFMRKPSGSIVTYRLHISKPSKASDGDEDEYDDTDEEKPPDKSIDGEAVEDAVEDDPQHVESDVQFGVTPFLSGVLPAGRLKARTKPPGCQASGLIQVNGKSYNQARLLLGNMGSLHPANRLAAFITGRLIPPGGISLKVSRKSNPTNKTPTPDPLHMKAAGAVVPPVTTAKSTTHLKPPTQPPVPIFPAELWPKGSIQNSSSVNPFASAQRSSAGGALQKGSASSPVSLTVSQSLKTPSFLGQSGTYSFRICPPANQGTPGQKSTGVTLPGGFTLIELPPPGADGADGPDGADGARPRKDASLNVGRSAADSDANRKGLNSCADLSAELVSVVKIPSDENDETNRMQVESNPDVASEDFSSDSSDSDSSDSSAYSGDRDGNDEVVDIETVEEVGHGLAIAQMKEAARTATKTSGEPRGGLGSTSEVQVQDNIEECRDNRRRTNHTFLERQRRSEQRTLFDRLQAVLQSDPRAPRLRLLSLAQKEIQTLTETSRSLEEKKRRLTQMQSVYVKELSLLSGKSGMLIRNKLKDICEKQKVREKKATEWNPFFSNLLESKAALVQSSTPKQPKLPAKPLLEPDFFRALFQTASPATAGQNKLVSLFQSNLKKALTQSSAPPPKSPLVSFAPWVEVPAPSPQGGQRVKEKEEQEKKNAPPAHVIGPTSQKQTWVLAAPQDPAARDEASSSASKPPDNAPQSFSLPLIRSKTGRLILPSSLKPLGHGFYTLMVMEPRPKGEEDAAGASANVKPCDAESWAKPEEGSSEPDPLLDPGSGHRVLEDEKTAQASKCNPKPSSAAELPLFNKSLFAPSVALQVVESCREAGALPGLKATPTACLSFNRVTDIPASAEEDPSPASAGRCRGRPRKHPGNPGNPVSPLVPVVTQENPTAEGDVGKRKASLPVKEGPGKKLTEGSSGVRGKPAPVKRRPGRPPNTKKKKAAQMWCPPSVLAGSCPPDSKKEDGAVRLSCFKSPDCKPKESLSKASRPLTRGALGKDFPSAKKRSWIDVEKELEPEIESDSE